MKDGWKRQIRLVNGARENMNMVSPQKTGRWKVARRKASSLPSGFWMNFIRCFWTANRNRSRLLREERK